MIARWLTTAICITTVRLRCAVTQPMHCNQKIGFEAFLATFIRFLYASHRDNRLYKLIGVLQSYRVDSKSNERINSDVSRTAERYLRKSRVSMRSASYSPSTLHFPRTLNRISTTT